MTMISLQTFSHNMNRIWGPLTTELAAEGRRQVETLLAASSKESWVAALHRTEPASEELVRDLDHGFVLLAHTEQAGLYRAPHDHGRSWVIYGIQHGEVEMGAYAPVTGRSGRIRLVQREARVLRAGDAQVYLPGDIHDTRCLSDTALLFRFTERDLKVEDRIEHRVTRYVQQEGGWAPPVS